METWKSKRNVSKNLGGGDKELQNKSTTAAMAMATAIMAMATPSFSTLSPQSVSTTASSHSNGGKRRVTLLGRMEREIPLQCAFFANIGREIPGVTLTSQSSARAASSSKGDHEPVNVEKDALEQQKLAQTEVGETVARAEAKVRVAAAAASAAGFAVEVAKQQGAPEDKTEAVGKAADAVAKVALKAAKVVKKVQENVAKSSTAAVAEQEEIIKREIERERRKLAKDTPERDP